MRREHALSAVRQVLARFIDDVARLLAGHDVDFAECATGAVADGLRSSVDPFLRSGARLAPDFGQFAEVSIAGALIDDAPLRCTVSFEDRSAIVTRLATRQHPERRRVELRLSVAGNPPRVQECRVSIQR